MEEKSYEQIAFEAYRDAVGGVAYDGTPIPQWGELRDNIKNGWLVAGLAVVNQVMQKILNSSKTDESVLYTRG